MKSPEACLLPSRLDEHFGVVVIKVRVISAGFQNPLVRRKGQGGRGRGQISLISKSKLDDTTKYNPREYPREYGIQPSLTSSISPVPKIERACHGKGTPPLPFSKDEKLCAASEEPRPHACALSE